MIRNRFAGEHPKVGIRPVIDGRMKGVRESLEDQTMAMATNVARLISSTLYHADGTPFACVIADHTIGRVAEAAACADKFQREGVGLTLTVTPCWCYGTEVLDLDPLMPKAIWGFNGTERPGAVFLAAALAGHNQKGLPAFGIYGREVQDADDTTIPEDVKAKIIRYTKAAMVVAELKGKSYLSIGGQCMGIAGSIIQQDFFQEYLGMRCESVDQVEILRRIDHKIYDEAEFKKAIEWTNKYCVVNEGVDYNRPENQLSRAEKEEAWEFVVKVYLIVRDMMIGNPILAEIGFPEEALGFHAIAGGIQGQRQWTDYKPNHDFTEALLNSSFDWNGVRESFVIATENDTLNGTAMLLSHLLTNRAQVFADVRTCWTKEAVARVTGYELTGVAEGGLIHLLNSGAAALDGNGEMSDAEGRPVMKPFWEITDDEVEKTLAATTWFPANRDYFRGGGFSSGFLSKGGMPVTLVRLNYVKGLGPVLQLAEGWTVDLPVEVHQILNDRTDKTWPSTWFAPRTQEGNPNFKDAYSVMNSWGANHGAFSYGHIGADLITLASILRIPVCMHNVESEDIYRPSAWSAFGSDPEGSDYRACAAYGPLYK
ncbi:MAG: L-fucose isomerase [Bacteroidales bacterium]|nr:L-fucose isomerase [Bacteroidales bacterium]